MSRAFTAFVSFSAVFYSAKSTVFEQILFDSELINVGFSKNMLTIKYIGKFLIGIISIFMCLGPGIALSSLTIHPVASIAINIFINLPSVRIDELCFFGEWNVSVVDNQKARTINKLHDCTWAYYLHSKQNSSAWWFLLLLLLNSILFIHLHCLSIWTYLPTPIFLFVFSDDLFEWQRRPGKKANEIQMKSVQDWDVLYVSDVWSLMDTNMRSRAHYPLSMCCYCCCCRRRCTVFNSIGVYMQFYQLYAVQLPFSFLLCFVVFAFSFIQLCNKLFIYCNRRAKTIWCFFCCCYCVIHTTAHSHTHKTE